MAPWSRRPASEGQIWRIGSSTPGSTRTGLSRLVRIFRTHWDNSSSRFLKATAATSCRRTRRCSPSGRRSPISAQLNSSGSSDERTSAMKVVIGWLYGATMNIYGDRGNIIALSQRARWRGVDADVVTIGVGDPLPPQVDIYFFGGGQDQEQIAVSRDLQGEKGQRIKADIEAGAAAL